MARVFWPSFSALDTRNPERLVHILRGLMLGQVNAVLDVELDSGTTTVVDNALILEQSAIILVPVDSAAAALGVVWSDAATQVNGQFTLTHPTAVGGESYRVLVIG